MILKAAILPELLSWQLSMKWGPDQKIPEDTTIHLNLTHSNILNSLISSLQQRQWTIPGGQKKPGTVYFFRTLLWSTVILFSPLLDKPSFPHYNNKDKIIKFGWELFVLRVISYGLSFSGFAINPFSTGTGWTLCLWRFQNLVINLSLIVPRDSGNRANPENDSA